jgi:spore coat protein CotH
MRRFLLLELLLLVGCAEGDEENSLQFDVFDENAVTTYEITMAPADWAAIVADPQDNSWRNATVQWRSETFPNCAVRPSGRISRTPGNPKPSLRISFNEFVPGRKFHGLTGVKLDGLTHDPSMMRDRLSYGVYRARGVPAPRYAHARVKVNGDLKGLYGVEERINKSFVERNFGQPVQQLYDWPVRDDSRDLDWQGPTPLTLYVPVMFEPRIEGLPDGAAGVRNLVDAINNNPAAVPGIFDVDQFLNFMAVEVVTGQLDAYMASLDVPPWTTVWSNNFYLYLNPQNGKYLFLPWDRDHGYRRTVSASITHGFDQRVVTNRVILQVPANLAGYRQCLQQLLDGPHATGPMQARVDFIHALIQPAALEDALKPYTSATFLQEVANVRLYIQERNTSVQQQLLVP